MIAELVLVSAISIFIYMLVFYIIAQFIKDNSIVDIGWGGGFIIVSLVLLFYTENYGLPQLIMLLAVVLWGLRLSIHIFARNKGKEEDFRYANWRKQWGKMAWLIAFFKVFMLQGLVMLIVSLPIIINFAGVTEQICFLHYLGIALFLIGYYFEVVGDYQMSQFKKKPENKGRIIEEGLWKHTRHPNYFGEAVLWWGIFFMALPANLGWIAVISPLVMTFLLRYGSGVPMLEKKYEGREDWEAYKKRTPVFFPFIKF
ncbi:MAG: DUF1295 domain-containing protein [Bacteroidales bacterium]|nr:DUF1295 domain-containing protein [Bacteroidales bacterium]MCF8388258.1 DUF1295 domain-containing protein [Bacteroidales bacterium]